MKDFELNLRKILLFVFLGIVGLIFLVGSWYIVPAGNIGVLMTLGKVSDVGMNNGFHFKAPLFQKVIYMDIQTQKYETKASAASSDLQVVSTDIAVNYHLSKGSIVTIYQEIGVNYADRIIQPAVQEVVKASTAHYTAEQLITKRANVKDEIDKTLAERLLGKGIVLETTSITNFDFSAQFNAAIEAKVTQEQQALTAKNKLDQVQYEAQQLVATANGQRDAQIAVATGEAKKVELIQLQLAQSPNYVEYIKATKWDGKLPTTMFGTATPLVQFPLNNS
jgi:prohibitin 2